MVIDLFVICLVNVGFIYCSYYGFCEEEWIVKFLIFFVVNIIEWLNFYILSCYNVFDKIFKFFFGDIRVF